MKSKIENRNSKIAASFRRIAQDHRSYARSHGFVARQKNISPIDKARHRTLSVLHRETADIHATEAKRLKGMK
jgi:hypothetical protein